MYKLHGEAHMQGYQLTIVVCTILATKLHETLVGTANQRHFEFISMKDVFHILASSLSEMVSREWEKMHVQSISGQIL